MSDRLFRGEQRKKTNTNQKNSTPVVIVIILVIMAVVAGVYFKSTQIKPIHIWTKEDAQRKMAETAKEKAGKGSSPAAPATKTKP